MKGTKLLLSFWLSTAAFCSLQVVYGPGGLTEMTLLREQQARLEVRLDALREDNRRLTARYESLRTSPEAIRLEARSLGVFARGEIPVRTLDGADFHLPSEAPDLSLVPSLPPPSTDSSWFFRLAWPMLFFSFFSLFVLYERMVPENGLWDQFLDTRRESLPAVLQSGLDFFRK